MDQNKLIELANKLLAATQKGEIPWIPRSSGDSFRAKLGNTTLGITKSSSGGFATFELSVIDESGVEIASLLKRSDSAQSSVYGALRNLHAEAHNSYYKVDEKVDNLINTLDRITKK